MSRVPVALVAGGVAALTLVAGVTLGPRAPRLSDDRTGDSALAARIEQLAEGGVHHTLTAAVVTREGTVFAGLGADETTTVEIGSITKTLTSLLLAQAVEDGTVDLDDQAGRYLDLGSQSFTLGELASHRSGLPRLEPGLAAAVRSASFSLLGRDPYTNDVDDLVAAARDADVSGEGTVAYSNFGVAVLGQAVAAARESSYADLLERDVFEPLGMTASDAPVTKEALAADAPRGLAGSGRPAEPWTMNAEAPAGGVRSTAADMARYAKALLTADPALGVDPATTLDPRFDDGDRRIGLAWFTETLGDRAITWHNGGTGGYSSMLALDREAGSAVFVSGDTTSSVDEIALKLLEEAR